MLQTRHLTKIYKPKKGVPVKALNGVSLKFSDTGMIFLLGKSGSGKSTLLNMLGGLDKYDGGEIIIKGVSSKDFKQKHFDSYRNTYVGFIFQEYNILDEFSVGANIALALELQGKKATDAEINSILHEVDLDGYGNRRPNELSGGQKQRVAIARALVKNPKIIMADEPTGALDSATGKQVFDTLKKLSKSKLVIVVSHDREFASHYADRIIELADGRVVSDTTVSIDESPEQASIVFEGNSATIPMGYHLTEEDRVAINEYIDKLNSGMDLTFSNGKTANRFEPTTEDSIVNEDKTPFKLIKSKLSLKHAFKIGGSSLKHKKFRLVMTILLSCIAFALFGLADTFGSYDHIKTCTNSIIDSKITYASLMKSIKYGEGVNEYWSSYGNKITKEELKQINTDTGINFKGVLSEGYYVYFEHHFNPANKLNESNYRIYAQNFSGIVEISQKDIEDMGYKILAGTLPDGTKDEIAISEYVCKSFIKGGYWDCLMYNDKGADYQTINTPADMVGKTISSGEKTYTITAVIDTKLDWERYSSLTEASNDSSASDQLIDYVLYNEFNYAVSNNFTGMMMVGEGKINNILDTKIPMSSQNTYYIDIFSDSMGFYSEFFTKLEYVDPKKITWLYEEKDTLADNEIIITLSIIENYFGGVSYDENKMPTVDLENLKNYNFNIEAFGNNEERTSLTDVKIVGIILGDRDRTDPIANTMLTIIPDNLFDKYAAKNIGDYDSLLAAMPQTKEEVEELVSYCYKEDSNIRYSMGNPVCYELDTVNEILGILSKVFLYIGIGFAVFASILLSNFIATSISYKKQEIGILRAIGSRGNDVFRIFFAESFIIAMINFVLSCVGVFAVTSIINIVMRNEVGILITILNFGIRQAALLFIISVAVAFIASFLPVKKNASKRPIDAIRNR